MHYKTQRHIDLTDRSSTTDYQCVSLYILRASKDNQASQDHLYVNAFSPLKQPFVLDVTVETFYITVCEFRDHQVLPAKLEGKGFLGSKGKK